jgi:hypothetical protein
VQQVFDYSPDQSRGQFHAFGIDGFGHIGRGMGLGSSLDGDIGCDDASLTEDPMVRAGPIL